MCKEDMVLQGKAFIDGGLKDTFIAVKDGRIAAIGREAKSQGVTTKIKEGIILPGFVDPHVHFRDPGMTWKEDFSTGTMAALHAGITCVLDMPNTKPPVDSTDLLLDKKKTVSAKAYTDYGLFAAVTADCDVERMAPHCAGFKLFMGSTTGNILMNDQDAIEKKFREIAKTGRTVSVHAEDDSMISGGSENGNRDHLNNRPIGAELNAVRRLAGFRDNRINICHVTSAETASMAAAAGMTTEVTSHHLFLDCPDNSDAGYKVNPPLRMSQMREMLMRKFLDGGISMIGSDHAPHTEEEKSKDYGNAPSGMSGVETAIPLLLNMVRTGTLPLDLLVKMISENPAERFGMNKGRIKIGYDADLVVVDMDDVRKIKGNELHGKSKSTVYEGWDSVFPGMVVVRGNIQIEDGKFCGDRIGEDIRG